jgi:hypothetical protein
MALCAFMYGIDVNIGNRSACTLLKIIQQHVASATTSSPGSFGRIRASELLSTPDTSDIVSAESLARPWPRHGGVGVLKRATDPLGC